MLINGIPIKRGMFLVDFFSESPYLKVHAFEPIPDASFFKQVDYPDSKSVASYFFSTPTELAIAYDKKQLVEGEIIGFAIHVSEKE